MDKLSIVRAVFAHAVNVPAAFSVQNDEAVKGYAVGYRSPKAIRPRKNESYAIIFFVDPETTEEQLGAYPGKIRIARESIPLLAGNAELPSTIVVQVRIERRRPLLLHPLVREGETLSYDAIPHSGGDPLYTKNVLIGTAGYVFRINGSNHLVSNRHVLEGAGIGHIVSNEAGLALAKVNQLNKDVDSGTAELEPGIGFSKGIPGIGTPGAIRAGIGMNMVCRKRGAATGVTEFRIKSDGVYNGTPIVIGVNVKGNNVPTVGRGDSGAVVVGEDNAIMALVFAGDKIIGEGQHGELLSEIWAIDISKAFEKIELP